MRAKHPAAVALGSLTSARKARSSAANGAKGGRPRTVHCCAVCGEHVTRGVDPVEGGEVSVNPLALAQALGIGLAANVDGPTVDVDGAAVLLKTTPRAIYVRHQRGQMPKPLPGSRRLVWRVSDLLRRGA